MVLRFQNIKNTILNYSHQMLAGKNMHFLWVIHFEQRQIFLINHICIIGHYPSIIPGHPVVICGTFIVKIAMGVVVFVGIRDSCDRHWLVLIIVWVHWIIFTVDGFLFIIAKPVFALVPVESIRAFLRMVIAVMHRVVLGRRRFYDFLGLGPAGYRPVEVILKIKIVLLGLLVQPRSCIVDLVT